MEQKTKHIVGLNLLVIVLFLCYLIALTSAFRQETEPELYWMLMGKKMLFFFVPVYVNNLLLIRFLFDREKFVLYTLSLLSLLALMTVVTELTYDTTILRSVFTNAVDLLTGTGALFIYRYIKSRNERQEQQLLQRQVEIDLLKTQLDQHFLFNGLNTIYSHIKNNPDLALTLTEKFSELLRYQLEKTKQPAVTLEEELDFVSNFILIQELRFGQHTNINFEIEGETKGLLITPMLLISFVENAFKHGNLGDRDAFIDICIEVIGNKLKVMVRNSYIHKNKENGSLQMGLANASKRLRLLYPNHDLIVEDHENIHQVKLSVQLERR